jgi:hypothetical protein
LDFVYLNDKPLHLPDGRAMDLLSANGNPVDNRGRLYHIHPAFAIVSGKYPEYKATHDFNY